jgi:hypothetical protein
MVTMPAYLKPKPITKTARKCERYLRRVYPNLYRLIQGYFLCPALSELEFERIKAHVYAQHIDFSEISFALYPFLGITEDPIDREPIKRKSGYGTVQPVEDYTGYKISKRSFKKSGGR